VFSTSTKLKKRKSSILPVHQDDSFVDESRVGSCGVRSLFAVFAAAILLSGSIGLLLQWEGQAADSWDTNEYASVAASRRGGGGVGGGVASGAISADGKTAYVVIDGVRVSPKAVAGPRVGEAKEPSEGRLMMAGDGEWRQHVRAAPPLPSAPLVRAGAPLPPTTQSAESAAYNFTLRQRREKVRSMMSDAWGGYKLHAWGSNELRPMTKTGHSAQIFGSVQGATIVDALDTLLLMNMTREATDAREWIATHLHFDIDAPVSTFEVCIRYLGGLLSAYALTGDDMYKAKAVELGDRLLPAFNTNTGIPWSSLNLRSGAGSAWSWAPGGCAILSELGTMSLEFEYLSR
jgi:hypothetical protein